jgi:hypothetical protein
MILKIKTFLRSLLRESLGNAEVNFRSIQNIKFFIFLKCAIATKRATLASTTPHCSSYRKDRAETNSAVGSVSTARTTRTARTANTAVMGSTIMNKRGVWTVSVTRKVRSMLSATRAVGASVARESPGSSVTSARRTITS